MGPNGVLSAPGGPHVGPINLAIRDGLDELQIHPLDQLNLNASVGCIRPHVLQR